MSNILERFLQKVGVKSSDQLSPEEKVTYENWRKILSKDDLTLKDIKEFCQTQVALIEIKWKDYNLSNEMKAQLIPYHTVYRTLEQVVEAPKQERENLEKQLEQLINV